MGQTGHMFSTMKLEYSFLKMFSFCLEFITNVCCLVQTPQVTDQTVKFLSLLNNSFLCKSRFLALIKAATIMSHPKSNKHVSS